MAEIKNMVVYVTTTTKKNEDEVLKGGIGVHGYTYVGNQSESPISPNKLNYTPVGYYNLVPIQYKSLDEEEGTDDGLEDDDLTPIEHRTITPDTHEMSRGAINPLKVIDITETVTTIDGRDAHRVILEFIAFHYVLNYITRHDIKKINIISNNEFVINVLTKWGEKWKENGWVKVNGQQVEWQSIIEPLLELYLSLKPSVEFHFTILPASSTHYGIIKAENNAIAGALAGINDDGIHTFSDEFMKDKQVEKLYLKSYYIGGETIAIDENGDEILRVNKHPYFNLKDILFFKQQKSTNTYYTLSLPQSNKKSEVIEDSEKLNSDHVTKDFFDTIGKRDQVTLYQVIKTEDDVDVVNKVMDFTKRYDKTAYNKAFFIRLNQLYNQDNYNQIMRLSPSVFPITGGRDTRLIIKDNDGKILLSEISPPRRLKDAVEELSRMESLLSIITNPNETLPKTYQLTDISDYVFVKTDKKVTIHPEFKHSVKMLKLPFKYYVRGQVLQAMYQFKLGYDMPGRSQFLHSCDNESKVSILTWPEEGLGVRYAFISQYSQGVAIWSNWYANVIIIKQE